MRIPLRNESPGGRFARLLVPVVFILGGSGMAWWFLTQPVRPQGLAGVVPVLMALGFVLSGVYSLYGEVRARGAAEEARRRLEAHRDAPWRARPAWRGGELQARSPLDPSLLRLTIFWNLVAWPLAGFLLLSPDGGGEGPVWLVGLFPLVGLVMLATVLVQYRRGTRFGRTTLVMDPWPARLGGSFRGTLRTTGGGSIQAAEGVLIQVSCYRQYVRHTRDSDGDRRRRVERDLLWRDETRIRDGLRGAGAGLEIPFSFRLPDDLPPSNPLELESRILWEVSAQAELSGPDLETAVEIPVFPLDIGADSGAEAGRLTPADGGSGLSEGPREASGPEIPGAVERAWPFVAPITEGIELVERPGAFELHFTAARNRKGAVILGIAGAVSAVLGVVLLPQAIFWGLGLVAVAGLLVYGSVQQATNDTVLRIRDGVVEVAHDGIGMPADVTFPVGNLGSVEVRLDGGTGSNRGYTLSLVAASNEGLEELEDQTYRAADVLSRMGVAEDHPAMDALYEAAEQPRVMVAAQLQDKDEADWLAYKIREAARRQAEE